MSTKPTEIAPTPMRNGLVIFTLTALAHSPLYGTLQSNPAYFVVNDVWPGTIIGFAMLTIPCIPLAFTLIAMLIAYRFPNRNKQLRPWLIAFLFTLCFLPLTSEIEVLPWPISILLTVGIGIGLTRLLKNNDFIAIGLAIAAPATLLFPVTYLLSDEIQELLDGLEPEEIDTSALTIDHTPPIVMVVFDEFPTVSLLDAEGNLDARRFPNIAAFGDESTWYPYATTVHDYTLKAVPAILTGNYPIQAPILPLCRNYPDSLFSQLEGAYALNTIEQATSLAPNSESGIDKQGVQNQEILSLVAGDMFVLYLHALLPSSLADQLVPMQEGLWGGFLIPATSTQELSHGEPARLIGWRKGRMGNWHTSPRVEDAHTFIDSIADFPRETFHFYHAPLPHNPWTYLPSGKQYSAEGRPERGQDGITKATRYDADQRAHLAQVAMVDRWIGKLVATLKNDGLYDNCMLVLVADHGVDFDADWNKRILEDGNFAGIGFVPLFIKYPNQSEGVIDISNVQNIDIAPTVLDLIMDGELPSRDGRSLLDANALIPDSKTISSREQVTWNYTESEYNDLYHAEIQFQKTKLNLTNPAIHVLNAGRGSFRIGSPDTQAKLDKLDATIDCSGIDAFQNVNLEDAFVPAQLTGTIACDTHPNPEDTMIVATINGLIAGTATPYADGKQSSFVLLINDELLQQGMNSVEVFAVPAHYRQN